MRRRPCFVTKTFCLSGAVSMLAALFPIHAGAADGGAMVVPICTNGVTRYVAISLGDSDLPPQKNDQAACHGPCICTRKKATPASKPIAG